MTFLRWCCAISVLDEHQTSEHRGFAAQYVLAPSKGPRRRPRQNADLAWFQNRVEGWAYRELGTTIHAKAAVDAWRKEIGR